MIPDNESRQAQHWQQVYTTKDATKVGWYSPHLETSLHYISRYTTPDLPLYDIGGGASTLVDDLLAQGYQNLTVLDISAAALQIAQQRLGLSAQKVHWIKGDISRISLPPQSCALWHDRAVFHFLTDEDDRKNYITTMTQTLRPGAHLVMATFAPDGPKECSGLPTLSYDATSLATCLGDNFVLCESQIVTHITPFHSPQQFHYACFQKKPA